MQDKRAYHKQAGHCTRCGDPFGGSRATAFMVWEYVVWQVLGDSIALCQDETVPVCEALRDRQRASRRDAGDHMQGLWPVDARARADARLENRTDLFDPLRPT